MELQEIKDYLRVDSEEENEMLLALQKAAEDYLLNAGITIDYKKELYKLAIKLLISHWYENRTIIGKADKLSFSLDAIIMQLQYTV